MRGSATYSILKRLVAAMNSDQHKPAPNRVAATNTKKPAAPDEPEPEAVGALVRDADYYREGGQ